MLHEYFIESSVEFVRVYRQEYDYRLWSWPWLAIKIFRGNVQWSFATLAPITLTEPYWNRPLNSAEHTRSCVCLCASVCLNCRANAEQSILQNTKRRCVHIQTIQIKPMYKRTNEWTSKRHTMCVYYDMLVLGHVKHMYLPMYFINWRYFHRGLLLFFLASCRLYHFVSIQNSLCIANR